MTPLLRQDDVATSFWRNNALIITSWFRWGGHPGLFHPAGSSKETPCRDLQISGSRNFPTKFTPVEVRSTLANVYSDAEALGWKWMTLSKRLSGVLFAQSLWMAAAPVVERLPPLFMNSKSGQSFTFEVVVLSTISCYVVLRYIECLIVYRSVNRSNVEGIIGSHDQDHHLIIDQRINLSCIPWKNNFTWHRWYIGLYLRCCTLPESGNITDVQVTLAGLIRCHWRSGTWKYWYMYFRNGFPEVNSF